MPTDTEVLRVGKQSCPVVSGMARTGVGFTLVEMMVVMVLLGLLTTLALPAMQRWYDSVQARAQTMGIVEALRAAAFAAGTNRHRMEVDAQSFVAADQKPTAAPQRAPESARTSTQVTALTTVKPDDVDPMPTTATSTARDRALVALPKGWQVAGVEPAAFLANGLCSPGLIAFKTEAGASVNIEIQGPTCSVGVADAPSAARR